MKILNLIVIAAVLSVSSVFAQATRELQRDKNVASTEKRTALVIGNGAYGDAPLTCTNEKQLDDKPHNNLLNSGLDRRNCDGSADAFDNFG